MDTPAPPDVSSPWRCRLRNDWLPSVLGHLRAVGLPVVERTQPLKRLKFCLDLSHHEWIGAKPGDHPAMRTLERIRIADQAGVESIWLSEDPDGWDAFAVLSAATQVTTHARLGVGVTNPYLRHPNLIAQTVSTLDQLSGGRAFLGLGRGQPEWYRMKLDVEPRKPLRALEDTFRLLRQWWTPPYRATSDGAFHVDDWARAIGPVQEHVPIYIAALGPKALDLAAQHADGLLVSDFASIDFIRGLVPEMRERVRQFGRDPDEFSFYLRTGIQITDNPGPGLARRKNLMALLTPLPGMSRHMVVPGYDIEGIVGELRRVMRTEEELARGGNFLDIKANADYDAVREIIPDDLIDELSYVGPAEKIRSKLERFADAGVTHAFMSPPDPGVDSPEDYARRIAQVTPRGTIE